MSREIFFVCIESICKFGCNVHDVMEVYLIFLKINLCFCVKLGSCITQMYVIEGYLCLHVHVFKQL